MRSVRPNRNPLRTLFSPAPWLATVYLASYLLVGTFLFCVTVTVLAVSGALSITWVGLPLLVAAAVVVRGCADIERGRALLVGETVRAEYRDADGGIRAQIGARWKDPATLRDIAYLVIWYLPLIVLDAAALIVWGSILAGVTLPAWYWLPYHTWPDGHVEQGLQVGIVGLWVGDPATAVFVALVFLVLAVPGAYVVVGAARLHAFVARRVLGPPVDPLADAKRVLAGPGPLAATFDDN